MRRTVILASVLLAGACGGDDPPTAPTPAAVTVPAEPVRVEQFPVKIQHVQPNYPADARARRIQGVVILDVVLDRTGRVSSVQVLQSPDVSLENAAIEAVRQWEYAPTLVNGQPVSIILTVTVSFTLQ